MKNYYNKQLNDDICKVHINNIEKYICHCINCKINLCRECLKSRIHLNHNKNNIIETQPTQEKLNIMKELIDYYKTKGRNLKNENLIINKKLDKSLNDKKLKFKKIFEEKNQTNENKRNGELKLANKKFIQEIEEIKNKYEEEIKIKINEYENYNNNINNKYRKINDKNNIILKSKINELKQKYNGDLERLGYDKKKENLNNIIKFNEIIYHTYMLYNQNNFNCLNIKNGLQIIIKMKILKIMLLKKN